MSSTRVSFMSVLPKYIQPSFAALVDKAASLPLHADPSLFIYFNMCQSISFKLSPFSPAGFSRQGRASNCMKGVACAAVSNFFENNDRAVEVGFTCLHTHKKNYT